MTDEENSEYNSQHDNVNAEQEQSAPSGLTPFYKLNTCLCISNLFCSFFILGMMSCIDSRDARLDYAILLHNPDKLVGDIWFISQMHQRHYDQRYDDYVAFWMTVCWNLQWLAISLTAVIWPTDWDPLQNLYDNIRVGCYGWISILICLPFFIGFYPIALAFWGIQLKGLVNRDIRLTQQQGGPTFINSGILIVHTLWFLFWIICTMIGCVALRCPHNQIDENQADLGDHRLNSLGERESGNSSQSDGEDDRLFSNNYPIVGVGNQV